MPLPDLCSAWDPGRVTEPSVHAVGLGDRGRLVVPAAVRDRHGWVAGQHLVVIDTSAGLIVMSEDEALSWLRSRLQERELVAELLADRQAEAARECVTVLDG